MEEETGQERNQNYVLMPIANRICLIDLNVAKATQPYANCKRWDLRCSSVREETWHFRLKTYAWKSAILPGHGGVYLCDVELSFPMGVGFSLLCERTVTGGWEGSRHQSENMGMQGTLPCKTKKPNQSLEKI